MSGTGPQQLPLRALRGTLSDIVPPLLLTGVAVHELLYNHAPLWNWLLVLALIWPLVVRRRAPLPVLGICLLCALALWLADTFTLADAAILVGLYSVAAHRDLSRALAAAAAVEFGVILLAVRYAPTGSLNDAILLLTGSAAGAFFLGTTYRAQRRYLAAAQERAAQLQRGRQQQAELGAAAERSRIARELHDIVAHGLAVMVNLAEGAAGVATKNPSEAEQTMRQVALSGRESLAEMRKLLDVLRTPDAIERAPQPNLTTLEKLIDDVRGTGLTVTMTRTGTAEMLSPLAQATIYRIIQESLTNVLKHADHASSVTIDLDCRADVARFAVRDNGRPHPPQTHPGQGSGLRGMRERIAVFGGSVAAGPVASGWLVHGEIPLT